MRSWPSRASVTTALRVRMLLLTRREHAHTPLRVRNCLLHTRGRGATGDVVFGEHARQFERRGKIRSELRAELLQLVERQRFQGATFLDRAAHRCADDLVRATKGHSFADEIV